MIGRGAQGRPWVLAEVAAALHGLPAPDVPQGRAMVDLVARHYEAMLGFYGADLGGRVGRKHLGWYMDGIGPDPRLRKEVLTTKDPANVIKLLPEALSREAEAA